METRSARSDQISRLELYFKRIDRPQCEDDYVGDDTFFGDFWEPLEPELLEQWSIGLVPMTEYVHFVHMFKNSPDFICLSADKKIKDVQYTDGRVHISCKITTEPYYMYTICLDYSKSKFNLQYFLRTLQNSSYEQLLKSLEEQIDVGVWGTAERRLGVRSIVSKLREILINLAKATTALVSKGKRMAPIDATMHRLSRGGGSQGSGSHSTARPITPAPSRSTARKLRQPAQAFGAPNR